MKENMNSTPLNEIVFRYKEFGYNRCNVCMSPHTLVKWNNNYISFRIETAKSPDEKWDSALNYQIGDSGGGRGCFLLTGNNNGYRSEKEAIYSELIMFEERINSELREYAVTPQSNSDIDDDYTHSENKLNNLRMALKHIAIFKDRFNPRELDLFE